MKPINALYPPQQRCLFCGKPFAERIYGVCRECLDKMEERDRMQILPGGGIRSAFAYRGTPRDCLLAYKFRGETWRAFPMAQWIVYAAGDFQADMVVPVPIHPLRCIGRGYAQCVLLAKHAAALMEIPYEGRTLVRRRYSKPLYTVDRFEHARAVEGRYSLGRDAEHVRQKRVLLLDDICTTGSTLYACRDLLLEAGALQVQCVCFAAIGQKDKIRGRF